MSEMTIGPSSKIPGYLHVCHSTDYENHTCKHNSLNWKIN